MNDTERIDMLHIQMVDLYEELSILSKKSPDGLVNRFKLKYVNQILERANDILKSDNIPFTDFSIFNSDDMPTNSDVVLMLSQYLRCLSRIKGNDLVAF